MRGIGHTLSRLSTVLALIARAAIYVGAFTSVAYGQTSGSRNGNGTLTADGARPDEAAMAIPRLPHKGASAVAFPQPLSAVDAVLLRRIFGFQARGDIPDAARSASDLESPLLLGTVLANRYLSRYHRSTPDELTEWLARYRNHPQAPAIAALLLARLPKGTPPPSTPVNAAPSRSADVDALPEDIDPPRNVLARQPALDRSVLERAQHGNAALALRLIAASRNISPAYAAQLRAEVAQVLFTRNEDTEALRVALLSVNSTAATDQSALGFYIGGLAAWRLDRTELARTLFVSGSTAPAASASLRAATAFWASRGSRAMHDAVATAKWLQVAAQERLTFHGLLARRVLRMNTGIVPSGALLTQADVDAVAATEQGWRAFALLQIGQTGMAEAELRALWPRALANPVFGRALLMVVSAAGLADCGAQMAASLPTKAGLRQDELRFPVPQLRPAGGFSVDPALVYALTRLESNFDATAVSPAGARGLMQIMPATAQYITGDALFTPDRLHEPASNLQIGQRYVAYLARQDHIHNDLLRVLASYNWGPGSVARWDTNIRDRGDPLLFIEAIPVEETRTFVQHALLYAWLYAARLHLPASSLDELAAGEFPRFSLRRFTGAVSERKLAYLSLGQD